MSYDSTEDVRSIIKRLVGKRKIAQMFKQNKRDGDYFENNYETLRRKYPDTYVVIADEQVIGHGRNLKILFESLWRKGYDTTRTYVRRTYFKEEPPLFVALA